MHPALAALTPRQARALYEDREALNRWLGEHQLTFRQAIAVIDERMDEADAAPPVVRPNRRDTAALLAYVQRAARLPPRLRAVAALCLRDGATLDEAATRLGIARETVRVHLRRLRALQRAADARRLAPTPAPR